VIPYKLYGFTYYLFKELDDFGWAVENKKVRHRGGVPVYF